MVNSTAKNYQGGIFSQRPESRHCSGSRIKYVIDQQGCFSFGNSATKHKLKRLKTAKTFPYLFIIKRFMDFSFKNVRDFQS